MTVQCNDVVAVIASCTDSSPQGRADTPIDRLFLCGASAHPGGAVHGGPGPNAARAALARNGWLGAGYRTAIEAALRLAHG